MTRHIITAEKYTGNDDMGGRRRWILRDTTTQEIIGGTCPDYAATRAQLYRDCDQMWGAGYPWYGRRVHGGYSIQVD
jgi:hypothetical protein